MKAGQGHLFVRLYSPLKFTLFFGGKLWRGLALLHARDVKQGALVQIDPDAGWLLISFSPGPEKTNRAKNRHSSNFIAFSFD